VTALARLSALSRREPGAALAAFRQAATGRIVFTTSFGIEDQAITHLIREAGLKIEIVTLDTGRLFPETYDVWQATEERYGFRVKAYSPDAKAVQALVADQGINGFYLGVEARKACCGVRKVAPLALALDGAAGWVTGLRGDQSANRASAALIERDEARGLLKLNPLIGWSREEVVTFTRDNSVPVNALHDRGFLSIGCAPCTRALRPGEPERAGRWWWEDETKKECGLHVTGNGVLTRAHASEARR
jgi:phosphoadenosine phosphosulfate reductase